MYRCHVQGGQVDDDSLVSAGAPERAVKVVDDNLRGRTRRRVGGGAGTNAGGAAAG